MGILEEKAAMRRLEAQGICHPEAILYSMIQLYKIDQGIKEEIKCPKGADLPIRNLADRLMSDYDNLPEDIRKEFPKETVETAYKHLVEITTLPKEANHIP